MLQIQPWRALQTLFGYSTSGAAADVVKPAGLRNLAMNMHAYGKDPLSAWYSRQMNMSQDRLQAYKEFDDMDQDDVIVAALDLYAEDCCQTSLITGKRVWVEADDAETERVCNDLLERINADEQCFPIARETAKYGNSYGAVIQKQRKDGTPGEIIQLLPSPVYSLSRVEDDDGRLCGFCVCPIEQMGSTIGMMQPSDLSSGRPTDPSWSFIHWRILGRERMASYGTSMLWSARRSYKRLRMSEDALVVYRLKRSPDRFVFKIRGLAGMAPEDRNRTMRMIRQTLRKKHLIDPETGGVKGEMEPLGVDDDIIVDEEAVTVDRLTGSAQVNHVLDIEYLRKRFFGSLKIPPDYMGFSDAKSGFASESPLAYQDINFARVIKRLQHSVMAGFALLCQLNMCWTGIDPRSSKAKFTMHMNPVSMLDEKNRLELEKVRAETLEILQKTGKELGIDPDKWHAYLLYRSQIPVHLLRRSRDTDTGIVKGKVTVQESKEFFAKITEDINSKKLTPETREAFNKVLGEHVELTSHFPIKENNEIVMVESKGLKTIQALFSPCMGPNTYSSIGTEIMSEDIELPVSVKSPQKKGVLIESQVSTQWKSVEKQEEISGIKKEMEVKLVKMQEELREQQEVEKRTLALIDQYGAEFLEEDDDE